MLSLYLFSYEKQKLTPTLIQQSKSDSMVAEVLYITKPTHSFPQQAVLHEQNTNALRVYGSK